MQITIARSQKIESTAGIITDGRFAVIKGKHIDMTSYEYLGETEVFDACTIVTIYRANECHNMSDAGENFMKNEDILESHAFELQVDAENFFVEFVRERL
jgi:hypothetical protein